MPSPFPGMNPYLESRHWSSLHSQLIAEIARQLAPKLRPKYLVFSEERLVVETLDAEEFSRMATIPDVSIVSQSSSEDATSASVSVPPLRMSTIMPERVPHVSIEIRDREHRELVTAIEVLSPTNKRGEGRKEYLARRDRILMTTAHLVEIDLLRAGQRVPMDRPLPSTPYFVFLGRAELRPLCEVWPIALDSPLPPIPIPLLPGDADVALDLQLALTTINDLLGYDLAVDYTRPPEIPLDAEQEAWANERLRLVGLRK